MSCLVESWIRLVRPSQRRVIPAVQVQRLAVESEYPGPVLTAQSSAIQFALRAGHRSGSHTYFSAAPVDSEAHRSYLADLEALVVDSSARRQSLVSRPRAD
jgi:hypothetical protein